MKVSKWGNSLAIRLPASVVGAMDLKPGDEVEIHIEGDRTLSIEPAMTKEKALQMIDSLARPFPPDFKFDRDEANAR